MVIEKKELKIFPTLISVYGNVLTEKQCSLIKKFCSKQNTSNHGALIGKSSSSHSYTSNILNAIVQEISECSDLKDIISDIMNDYAKSLGIGEVQIDNSWFNCQDIGSILRQHSHYFSAISAALYVNVDSNSSKIYFDNPNQLITRLYSDSERGTTEYLDEYFYIKPENGYLVVFPSWINHGSFYEKNNTKNRLVISFNSSRKS